MGWLEKVQSCWSYEPDRYVPLFIAARPVGHARPDVAEVALDFGCVRRTQQGLALLGSSVDEVTHVLDTLSHRLHALGLIPPLTTEKYPVRHASEEPDLGYVDRSASLALGVRTYGVHLNACMRSGDALFMWVARRSSNRRYFPRMLDNLVAGGQPAFLSLRENLVKEACEEADLSGSLLARAIPGGRLAYRFNGPDGLVDSVTYTFDLELPPSFQPRNRDGGVEAFHLLPIDEVAERVCTTEEFKFNSALVIMDFLLRHAALVPEALAELERVRPLLYAPEPGTETLEEELK